MMDKGTVLQGDWHDQIREVFEEGKTIWHGKNYRHEKFLDKIWEMSLNAFDIPREVQVVVDAEDNLFITHGTPGLVWFDEAPAGMKMPLRCWIHTHPFGTAYFSGRDWLTINTWRLLLPEAIVLAGKEKMTWFRDGEYTEFVRHDYYTVKGDEEE
jgi:hypothetical protein